MNKYLLYLDIASYINESDSQFTKNAIRKQQYITGLKKLFEYDFITKNCDILITDNTCDILDEDIKSILPINTIIKCFNNNCYGCINKGAGLIQKLIYNKNIIINYEYIIYFEPRLLLKSFAFFNTFFAKPDIYFRWGDLKQIAYNHFFTGLFTIDSYNLLNFIDIYTPEKLIAEHLSIEYPIKDYICNKTNIIPILDVIWFESHGNIYHF